MTVLVSHLSTEELGQRFRSARDRVERSHFQGIRLLRQGYSESEVARVMGYRERWVAELMRRYNEDGPEGLADRRHGNAGAKPLLSEAQQTALAEVPQAPPPRGGLGTGPPRGRWRPRPCGNG